MSASLVAAAAIIGSGSAFGGDATESSSAAAQSVRLGLRGVHFVPNQGQWPDRDVSYGFRSRGLDVAFRESSLTMHLRREKPPASGKRKRPHEPGRSEAMRSTAQWSPGFEEHGRPARVNGDPSDVADSTRGIEDSAPAWEHLVLEVTFPGSNTVTPFGAKPQAARFNYFVGDDESRWAKDVPSFGAVVYENLYDGIDLHVMGSDGGVLKYEFHCRPGADHTQIRIRYDGIDALCVDPHSGDLLIETAFGTLRDTAPIVWQDEAGHSLTLPARFDILDRSTYTIALLEPHDPTRSLVIDPDLEWMYYYGGSAEDWCFGLVLDGSGDVLMSGLTASSDFVGRRNAYHGGDWDAFIMKVDPSGSVLWMTYLGGSGRDIIGYGNLAVDRDDNVLAGGWTNSTDFAGRINSYYGGDFDGFVVKLNPAGALEWMTYLGGSDSDNSDGGIVVTDSGDIIAAGTTASDDFVAANNSFYGGRWDVYLARITPTGNVTWSTYLGGSELEEASYLAIDTEDNVYMTGRTMSPDFVGRNNSYFGDTMNQWGDAFALKVDSSGTLQWMTYLGGSRADWGYRLAVDGVDGAIIVVGETHSFDFFGRNNNAWGSGGTDGWLARIAPSGVIEWMTYVAGALADYLDGIAIDEEARVAYVAGATGSSNLPARTNTYRGGFRDAFIAKMDHVATGEVYWLTYLGGTGDEWGDNIALDGFGSAFVIGPTNSPDFTRRRNTGYGGMDAFLVKFRVRPHLVVDATCPGGGPIRIAWEGATPGGQAGLIFALNTGSVVIPSPNLCAGTRLGLGSNQIQLAWQGSAGVNGSRILNATAPRAACGGYLQLLDVATCATSNVVRIE